MNAVITAGGRIDGDYARVAGTTVKALAAVRGETMLARAISAARDAGARAIAVVGGEDVRAACEDSVERVVAESDTGAENVGLALRAWTDDEPLLYLTSDMPYVGGDALANFVSRCEGRLGLPLCSHEEFERRFPRAPWFGIWLGRERVVNGGAFFVPPKTAGRVADLAARLFDTRKHPMRMARIAGPALLVRFLFGALSIDALESRAQRVLGLPAQAVRGCAPELAFDADDLDQYRYACENA